MLFEYSAVNYVKAGGSGSSQLATNLPSSTWFHVAVVSVGGTSVIYVDGVLTYTQTTAAPYAITGYMGFGNYDFTTTYTGDLYIDDCRLYDRPLTQAEITHLASQRGVLGTPFVGLGDEQLWLCPSLQDGVNDLSGNNNDGVYQGGMGTVTDVSNGGSLAYDFDGVSDEINCGDIFDAPTDFSISLWVEPSATPKNNVGLVSKWNGAGYMALIDGNSRFSIYVNGDGHPTNTVVSWGTWVHTVYVYDSSAGEVRFYENGVLTGFTGSDQQSTGPNTNSLDFAIGSYNGGNNFRGRMDDIRYFDRPITQSEITHLAEARGIEGPPPVGLGDEQLWLCPSLNDSANDISGNGNNGVYQNGMGTVADTSNGGSLAYDFDGTGDWIECSGPTGNSGAFSLAMWVSRGSSDTLATTVAAQYDATASNRYWFVQQKPSTTGNTFGAYPAAGTSSGRVDSETTSIAGFQVWYHLVAMYDAVAGEQRLYIDGVLADSDTSTGFQATTIGLSLGALDGVQFWEGRLDDVRQYDRSLTQSEITHLATSRGIEGPPPVGLGDEKLWLCPSLNDSANDISGNGNNGVYLGSAATIADVAEGGSRAYNTPSAGDLVKCVYQGTDSFSGWFYTSAANRGGSAAMFTGTNAYSSGGWSDALYFSGTGVFAKRADGAADTTTIPSVSVPAGAWFHYASVRTDAGMSYYVDGVNVAAAVTSTVDSSDLFVGNPTGSFPTGDFRSDDIRAYTRKLTQAEITHLATSRGIQGPASPTTLSTRYYDFGTAVSPVKAGYQKVTNAAYDANLFGWGSTETAGITINALDRGFFTDDMETDFCYTNIPRIFRDPTVVAGDYTIKAYCGDNNVQSLHMEVWNGGTWVATPIQITAPSGTMQTATANITVGENAVAGLYVRCRNSGTSSWIICGLDLTPAGGTPPTTQYNAFTTHAFTQLFQQRLR